MAVILAFSKRQQVPRQPVTKAAATGQIVFFTGVTIERHRDSESSTNDPASPPGTQSGRRRKA